MGFSMSTLRNVAMLSLVSYAVALPVDLLAEHSVHARDVVAATTYQAYRGDGSITSGWPAKDQWIATFDQMWDINYPDILATNPGHTDEASLIKGAINQAADETGVDARFILAIMMQESGGNLRAGTTSFGASGPNPGLMQSHAGPNCVPDQPCGYETILAMIMQGVQNGSDGVNLKNYKDNSGKAEPADYFWAARLYNSGAYSMTAACNDNLSCALSGATVTYPSDVANRLRGLTDATGARGAVRNPDLFRGEAC